MGCRTTHGCLFRPLTPPQSLRARRLDQVGPQAIEWRHEGMSVFTATGVGPIMLAAQEKVEPLYRCPRSGRPLRRASDNNSLIAEVENGWRSYPLVDGRPILIDFDSSVVDRQIALKTGAASAVERARYRGPLKVVKRLLSPEKPVTRRNVERLINTLSSRHERSMVLVVGGGTVGQGMAPLYEHPDIEVVGFDIYSTPTIQFVADGHRIPLADDAFDAVVVQAVLEHVLEPQAVVDEIWRVLKADGLVYAETPFMQQVHEGPYDFTRFTESGHRYLFRRFELIDCGASAGPATGFVWSTEYLVRSVLRSRRAGKIAKVAIFWMRYLDRLIPDKHAVDAASGVFFFGRKRGTSMTALEAIRHYRGAQGKHSQNGSCHISDGENSRFRRMSASPQTFAKSMTKLIQGSVEMTAELSYA